MNREERRRKQKKDKAASSNGKYVQKTKLSTQQSLRLAIKLHQGGRLKEAEVIYRQLITIKPVQTDALYLLALLENNKGNNQTAINLVTQVLAIKPDFGKAHELLALASLALNDLVAATASFQRAILIEPKVAETYNNLGNTLYKQGYLKESVESYRKAITLDSNLIEAHIGLGVTLYSLRRLEEAVFCYRAALSLNPDNVDIHCNLASALSDLGFLSESVSGYREAIRLQPDFAEAHNNLGNVLNKMGRAEEAVICCRKALGITPDYKEAHCNLGVACLSLGRVEEAIESLYEGDPDGANDTASYNLMVCYYLLKDFQKFCDHMEKVSRNQQFNFKIASLCAFVENQTGITNTYQFCEDPLNLVSVYNLLDTGRITAADIEELKVAIRSNVESEQSKPDLVIGGLQSSGNLFDRKNRMAEILEPQIRLCISDYLLQHSDIGGRLIERWPDNYSLKGWYVRLLTGGEIRAHTHEGWLSGVFYVSVPPDKGNNAGNIEFTLIRDDLPTIHQDIPSKILTSLSGSLILFPSSLPHRVIPFSEDYERLCIAFDMIPIN